MPTPIRTVKKEVKIFINAEVAQSILDKKKGVAKMSFHWGPLKRGTNWIPLTMSFEIPEEEEQTVRRLLKESYKDMKESRESGDNGFYDPTELELELKEFLNEN